jgi:hypothetical protein
MARNQTPGRRRIEIELEEELAAGLDALRVQFGHTMREEIKTAIMRHLSSPPPVPPPPAPPPPLPSSYPLPPVGEKRKRGRPRIHPPK